MIRTAIIAAATLALLAGPAPAANAPGAAKPPPAPRFKRCKPPTRMVWAVVKQGGPLQWSCYAAPESDCRTGKVPQVPVYNPATKGWVCKPCAKGEVVATRKVEGIVVGRCRKR